MNGLNKINTFFEKFCECLKQNSYSCFLHHLIIDEKDIVHDSEEKIYNFINWSTLLQNFIKQGVEWKKLTYISHDFKIKSDFNNEVYHGSVILDDTFNKVEISNFELIPSGEILKIKTINSNYKISIV